MFHCVFADQCAKSVTAPRASLSFPQIKTNQIHLFMSHRINHLLAHLPEAEFNALTSHMELVSLIKGQSLFGKGEFPKYIYFPIGAIVSMLNDMEDGTSVEVYMLTNTCVVGIGTLGQRSFYRAYVRSSGLAYRMSAQKMLDIRDECPVYLKGALDASHRMLMQLSQNIACGRRHPIEQQLIRWMLITLDRTGSHDIPITHQELAEILGIRREAITLNLAKLSSDKIVKVTRGGIEVLNRDLMEDRSCECYWAGQQRERPISRLNSPILDTSLSRARPVVHHAHARSRAFSFQQIHELAEASPPVARLP